MGNHVAEYDAMPWLLFRLKGQTFAVNAAVVDAVFHCDQTITPLPDTAPCIRGIFEVRGVMLPMVDLRLIMGHPSAAQEYQEFEQMLEMRKDDHIRWVEELERSVACNEPFCLATDPHQCAFGKWYDHYETDSISVRHHLNKIAEPHNALHYAATAALACKQLCESCKRSTCLRKELDLARDSYMPRVVKLLEEAKEVFRQSIREMCVILSHPEGDVGLLVDEVVGMEQLGAMTGADQFGRSGLLQGVASREGESGQILLLDSEGLIRSIAAQVS